MSLFSSLTILSLEQATTLPYMTLRLAGEGARVIRVETPGRGDPNRWVGPVVLPSPSGRGTVGEGEQGMNAYFLPNNLGKESITLHLGCEAGQKILHKLITELPVDVFATNQRPRSYQKLGIAYETLATLKPDLIWVGITGFGPDSDKAAYDPILQARAGFMELTGEKEGDPMVFGLPMVDLGAGEHAYGQVMKALYKRALTGEGSRVDLSMFQSAVSWMVSPVMLSQSFGIPSTRHGNTHQFFAPASVFPTSDGFVYMAVGNDRQWEVITHLSGFEGLSQPEFSNNAGRIRAVSRLNQEIASVTRLLPTGELIEKLHTIGVPVSRVKPLAEVCADPLVSKNFVRACDSQSGTEIAISAPPVISEFLQNQGMALRFPPRLGEHNESILAKLGYDTANLAEEGVI